MNLFHSCLGQHGKTLDVVDGLMAREECLEPVAPLIRDFPLHLQPYAHALIKSKLEESKYYVAVNQIRLHEQFDEFLASSKLDCDVYRFMFSKVTLPVQIDEDCMEVVVNKVPSKFWELEPALRKLSFETLYKWRLKSTPILNVCKDSLRVRKYVYNS
ncbi:uncharacterized protein LOC112271095 [Brachypodium distachyon]|nr:uncharacterized protein LOC112271095 [Brachypodium distachyon]|eukprot:XP_024315821.1 uncharacterized protein LOC112271095 [Brachypodium distachyon]